jgi:hypothetical protein
MENKIGKGICYTVAPVLLGAAAILGSTGCTINNHTTNVTTEKAQERVVYKTVEKPVIIEKIVEKKVYVQPVYTPLIRKKVYTQPFLKPCIPLQNQNYWNKHHH